MRGIKNDLHGSKLRSKAKQRLITRDGGGAISLGGHCKERAGTLGLPLDDSGSCASCLFTIHSKLAFLSKCVNVRTRLMACDIGIAPAFCRANRKCFFAVRHIDLCKEPAGELTDSNLAIH